LLLLPIGIPNDDVIFSTTSSCGAAKECMESKDAGVTGMIGFAALKNYPSNR